MEISFSCGCLASRDSSAVNIVANASAREDFLLPVDGETRLAVARETQIPFSAEACAVLIAEVKDVVWWRHDRSSHVWIHHCTGHLAAAVGCSAEASICLHNLFYFCIYNLGWHLLLGLLGRTTTSSLDARCWRAVDSVCMVAGIT